MRNDDIQFRVVRVLAPQTLPTISVFVYDDSELHRYAVFNDRQPSVRRQPPVRAVSVQ